MIEPWERKRHRFGFKLGKPAGGGAAALGWAVLELSPPPRLREGNERGDDILDTLVQTARREREKDGFDGVTLYRYANEAAFAGSRAAADGLTLLEHLVLIKRAAARLRQEKIAVTIEDVHQ